MKLREESRLCSASAKRHLQPYAVSFLCVFLSLLKSALLGVIHLLPRTFFFFYYTVFLCASSFLLAVVVPPSSFFPPLPDFIHTPIRKLDTAECARKCATQVPLRLSGGRCERVSDECTLGACGGEEGGGRGVGANYLTSTSSSTPREQHAVCSRSRFQLAPLLPRNNHCVVLPLA